MTRLCKTGRRATKIMPRGESSNFSTILCPLKGTWAVWPERLRPDIQTPPLGLRLWSATFLIVDAWAWQAVKHEDLSTLWSGVLEHLEAKGRGLLPPTSLRPGRLAKSSSKHQPVWAKGSTSRSVWTERVIGHPKSRGAMVHGTLAPFCGPLKNRGPFCLNGLVCSCGGFP